MRNSNPQVPANSGKDLSCFSRGRTSCRITLIDDGQIYNNQSDVAEIFNNYFVESCLNHSTDLIETDFDYYYSIDQINKMMENEFESILFSFQPVCTKYVFELLTDLNSSKATGSDNIPPRLLKVSASALAAPLTRLVNYCIEQSCWIDKWKESNITPVFKKDSEANKSNYRPVSILPSISKIFERVMYNQLYNYFVPHLLSDSLSGFLKSHSTCSALLKITENWRTALEEKQIVSVVSIDLIRLLIRSPITYY